jgi:predicted ester cyclase
MSTNVTTFPATIAGPATTTTTMTATTNVDLVHEFARRFNARDFDGIAEIIAVDLVDHHLPPELPAGRDGAMIWYRLLTDALDMRLSVEATVAEGDLVSVRASITGRHIGDFGGLPATGRSFTTSMISIERVASGCIAERWEIADHAAVIDQLTATS